MIPLDSAHRIGIFTLSTEILTGDQVVYRWRFKIVKSGTFLLAVRFGTSNRSIYPVTDVLIVDQGVCKWRFKIAKLGTFLLGLQESIEILQNGCHR